MGDQRAIQPRWRERGLVLQGQLDPAAREGPGHSDDQPTWDTASSQVVNGSVPVVLEARYYDGLSGFVA